MEKNLFYGGIDSIRWYWVWDLLLHLSLKLAPRLRSVVRSSDFPWINHIPGNNSSFLRAYVDFSIAEQDVWTLSVCAIGRLFPAEAPLKSRGPAGAGAEYATASVWTLSVWASEYGSYIWSPSGSFPQVANQLSDSILETMDRWSNPHVRQLLVLTPWVITWYATNALIGQVVKQSFTRRLSRWILPRSFFSWFSYGSQRYTAVTSLVLGRGTYSGSFSMQITWFHVANLPWPLYVIKLKSVFTLFNIYDLNILGA